MLSRFGIISWDFAVDENSEPILIEYNLNYPDVMIYQMNNGPLFGDLTQTILEDVREKLKKERWYEIPKTGYAGSLQKYANIDFAKIKHSGNISCKVLKKIGFDKAYNI